MNQSNFNDILQGFCSGIWENSYFRTLAHIFFKRQLKVNYFGDYKYFDSENLNCR